MADFGIIHGSLDPKNNAKWVSYGGSDAEFLIAPMNNPAFTNKVQKNTTLKSHRDDETLFKMSQDEIKHFIGTIILDWKNVQVDGEDWEFSEKNALKLFSSYPVVINWITEQAQEYEKEFGADLEADKKK